MDLRGLNSSLLIGKNGTGKSTILQVLEIFQSIGRGTCKVKELIDKKDFTQNTHKKPICFDIEVLLKQKLYKYTLIINWSGMHRELQVLKEHLTVSGKFIYYRKATETKFYNILEYPYDSTIMLDNHLIALPIIQELSENDPIHIFRSWLARMIILSPITNLMTGISNSKTLEPKKDGSNFSEWFSGLFENFPTANKIISETLHEIIPDFQKFSNTLIDEFYIDKYSKKLIIQFIEKDSTFEVDFKDLSDGEKMLFLYATIIAANKSYGPVFCFWDNPDKNMPLSDIENLMVLLRSSFHDINKNFSQILIVSHNPEVILKFSNENTFVLSRKNHLNPTKIKLLSELPISGNLVDTLIRGDI